MKRCIDLLSPWRKPFEIGLPQCDAGCGAVQPYRRFGHSAIAGRVFDFMEEHADRGKLVTDAIHQLPPCAE